MADVGATVDSEGVEDAEEVVDVGVEGGVSPEIEVIGVDAAGADQVIEHNAVVSDEVRQNPLPRRLIGADSVGEN